MAQKLAKICIASLSLLLLFSSCTSEEKKPKIEKKTGIGSMIYGSDSKPTWDQASNNYNYLLKSQKYKKLKAQLDLEKSYFPKKQSALAFYYGVYYFHSKKMKEAKKYFKQSEKALPGETIYYYGHMARKNGKLKKAVAYYDKAFKILKSADVLSSLGDIYYEHKKTDQAIVYYKKAITLAPESYMDRYFLANIYFQKKLFQKSETLLKKALDINPAFRKAYVGLYAIKKQQKKTKEALYYYSRALLLAQNYEKVAQILAKAEKDTYSDPRLLKFYLVSLFRNGAEAKAKDVLSKALKKYPQDPDFLTYQGINLDNEGQGKKAIKHFEKLIRKYPNQFNALVAFGDVLTKNKMEKRAAKLFEKALLIDPTNTSYRYKLAEFYRKQNDYQRELFHRGVLYVYQNQFTQGFEALVRVKKTDYPALLHFYLGKAYDKKMNYIEAEKNYRKVIEVAPNMEEAYLELAYVLVRQNKKQEALKVLNSYKKNSKEIRSLKLYIKKM